MNCPHWNPVRDIGSPGDLWRRDTNLGVLVGAGAPWKGAAVSAVLATRGPSPCAPKVRRTPEAFPLRVWARPEGNVFGGWHRHGDPGREKCCRLFSVRQDPSLYNTSQSAPSGRMGSFRTSPLQQSYHGASQSGTWSGGGIGIKIRAGKSIGQAHDRALIASTTAGREPRQAVVSRCYVWVELRQRIFSRGRHAFFCLFILTGRYALLLISVVILNYTPYALGPSKR